MALITTNKGVQKWPKFTHVTRGAMALAFLVCMQTALGNEPKLLRFGIDAADLGTGDPHRAASRNDRAIVDMLFNGLLRYKPGEAPLIEPDLATSIPHPRIVEGKQVWTFQIRKDGVEYGKITKKWSGLMKEGITDADNFGVVFPVDWEVQWKALFLGAVFLIDFVHFENKGDR